MKYKKGDYVINRVGQRAGFIGVVEDVSYSMLGVRYPNGMYDAVRITECDRSDESPSEHFDVDAG